MKKRITYTELLLEVMKSVKDMPNDQDLGKKVRRLIQEYNNQKNNDYIDNSHEKGY